MFTQRDGGGSHFCQIHHEDEALSEGVARFVATGIRNGQAVVVVATPARIDRLREDLADNGLFFDSALTVIDSRELLDRFMRQGTPDRALFFAVLRPVLRHATVSGTGQPRVYGEMVNDLWQDGNPEAASRLEELWNALLEEYRCSLFCGYVLDAFDLRSYDRELEGLCGAHADIEPTRSDRKVRLAIDEACLQVLGIHLSSILRHSQSECDAWHARLPPARRAIFWLKTNAPSRLGQVLGLARDLYGQSSAGLDA